MLKKNLANIFTCARIVGAVVLLFLPAQSLSFCIVYTLCGVTDVLDGWAARRISGASELGARLDSVADLSFYGAMLFKVVPILWEQLPPAFWLFVVGVVIIRLCSYAIAAIKFRRFASLHTYLNKLTGMMVFLLPYVLLLADKGVLGLLLPCCVICAVAGIASLEELIIHISAKEYDHERKWLGKSSKQ